MPTLDDILADDEPQQGTLDDILGNSPANIPAPVGIKPRGILGAAKDTAIDLAKGAVGLGQSAVGVADIVTGNMVGQGMRSIGYDPEATNKFLSQGYSDARKQANLNVEQAEGFVDTAKAYLQNPSAAFGAIAESAPSSIGMVGAVRGVAGKMLTSALAKNGLTAGTPEAAAFASQFFRDPKTIATLTGIGGGAEGLLTSGSIQEQGVAEGKDWQDTVLPALGAGALTGLIGVGSSKIPGFRDAEVALATAGMRGATGKGLLASGKEIAKSMFKEGVLEEMPQSAQEQVFTNLAMDKPWDEGVAKSAATGLVVGAGQGGGMSTISEGIGALKTDPAVEKVQADTLDKVLPEGATLDKLEGGEATVTIQTAAGTTTVTAAPEDIAKQMLAGKPLSEMAKQGVEARASRLADLEAKALGGEQFTPDERKEYQKLLAKSGTKKFEQLMGDPARPEVVRFRVADKVYEYAPPAGMNRAQIDAEMATRAKSPGSQFNWLKKNTVEVTDAEVKPQATPANEPVQAVHPGPEQVVDGVSESLKSTEGETNENTRSSNNIAGKVKPGATAARSAGGAADGDISPEAVSALAGNADGNVSGTAGAGSVNDTLNNLTFQHDTLVDQWEALPAGPEKTAVQEEIFKIREEMNNAAIPETVVPAQGRSDQNPPTVPEVLPEEPPVDGMAVAPAEVATKIDKDLKYDGDNLSLPQFTYQAGPLKGVTFSAKDASEESVRAAAEKMRAQWEGKKNNAVVAPEKAVEGVTPAKVEKPTEIVRTSVSKDHPFETSKAVTVEGFHGTPDEFTDFDSGKSAKANQGGIFFTTDHKLAKAYTLGKRDVIQATVEFKDPLVWDFNGPDDLDMNKVISAAKDKGHDGVIFKNFFEPVDIDTGNEFSTLYVTFKPERIKTSLSGAAAQKAAPAPRPRPEKKTAKAAPKPKAAKPKTENPLPSAYAVQAKVIAEDIAAGDTAFKRVPSEAAIRAYRVQNPRAKADAAMAEMAEMAEMDEDEYQGLTAVIEDEMVAWHGTPHTVDKFSSSKIGTGEGAQAYGYGLYFAGAKEVAQWYRDKLSARPESIDATLFEEKEPELTEEVWAKMVSEGGWGDDKTYALRGLLAKTLAGHDGFYIEAVGRELYNRVRAAAQKVYSNGKLYQVELAPAEDEFLLWDRPLSEQSEKVRAALKNIPQSIRDAIDGMGGDGSALYRHISKNIGNKDIMRHMMKLVDEGKISAFGKGDQKASEYLHSLGVRGIKYLDGTSRNKPLKDIKAEFLKELPEDAEFSDVEEMIGTGTFSPKNEAILKALIADDWLGFDYPAQAISAALGSKLSGYDPSPALVQAIADAQDGGTYNYVVFNDEDITILSAEKQDRDRLGDPTKAEAEKVQKGIDGKTLIQAAEWLISNTPNNGHKLIAAKVRVALLRLKGAGVEFNLNVTHVGDEIPASSANSRGVSTTDFSDVIKTTVRLNGADVTGKVGMSYETVLHELIHAATQAAIHVGNRKVSKGTTLAKTTADLITATNLIINHFNTRAKSGEQLTEFEQRILQRNVNALNNPSEVLAWTLSNKEMQDYLETVKLNKTETLWSRFVQSVRTFFGLTAASDTALSEVLRLGEDLLNADANVVTSSLDKLMGRTPVNEFAQDAQTDIRKATRVIQNMPAFKKWFGDSKVVDSSGKPLVVYHGGPAELTGDAFRTGPSGGIFFVNNKRAAGIHKMGVKDGAVHEVYLNLQNPYEVDYRGTDITRNNAEESIREAQANGHDSVIIRNFIDIPENRLDVAKRFGVQHKYKGDIYIAFSPTQIKSIFNQTWDPANPAIDMQVQTPLGIIADEQISEALKSGQKKLGTAVQALKNPKSKLHDLYVQYAPQWLAVTPLHTLVQTFGKTIPQIKDFAKHLDAVVSAKTEIVDTSKVVYDKAMEMAQKTVGLDVFNTAAATASFNRMTPWKDLYSQDWTAVGKTRSEKLKNAQKKWVAAKMQKATGLTYIEAYSEAKKAYDALKTDDMKQAYQDTVEHIAGIRTREKNNLLRYIEKVTEPNSDERKEMMLKFDATFTDLHGAYWPLARVGDFVLKYVDKDGFKWAEHFTTIAERNEAKAERVAAGVDPDGIKESYKDKQPAGAVAIPAMMLEQLSKTVRAKYMKDINPNDSEAVEAAMEAAQNTINDMTQIWLRWQPETSALKNSVRRKNVKGYSLDMLRSYLDYMQRHASNIAWTEQGKKIEGDLKSMGDDIKAKLDGDVAANTDMENHLLNDLRARVQALRSVKVGVAASFLGKVGTGWYMTSPSIALVQMTQLGALTLPKLAVKYGPVKAAKALALWTKEAFKKDYRRAAMFDDPVVAVLFDELHAVVTIDNRNTPAAKGKELGEPLFSEEYVAKRIADSEKVTPYQRRLLVLREAMARNLLDISAAHEAFDVTNGKDPNSLMAKGFAIAMKPMSLSELTSRKAAVLSTYDLASQDGKDFFLAMNDIAEVVNDTLYSYSKENKGAALQGGLTRVVLQFQHYRIMTGIRLAMLLNNAIRGESKEIKAAATKEFVGIMGMTGALAGSLGMPFAGTVFAILGAILGDDDEPEDYRLMYTNWLQDTFPKTVADLLTHGLPSLAGADISKRVGLQDVYGMQNEPPPRLHGKELAAWWAANQLGPTFSVGAGLAQGYDEFFNKGNYMKGLEAAAPKPIKDVFKAIRVATDGVKTGAGKKLIPDDQIGPDEVLMIALGFNPEEISKAQGAERSLQGIKIRISERRGKLIRRAAEAIIEGDGASDALEDIRKFNLRMPRFAIGGRDIKPAVRKILRGESGTTGRRERDVATQYEVPVYQE